MKKLIATILVLAMVFSFGAIALAADSPTIPVVKVAEASEDGQKALPDYTYEMLATVEDEKSVLNLKEDEVAENLLIFSYKYRKTIQIEVANVKKGDRVFVLYRDTEGNVKLLEATAPKDGIVQFRAQGEGDYMVGRIVPEKDAVKELIIPKTGDSYRLTKLILVALAAIAVMTAAGVAIKRSNA